MELQRTRRSLAFGAVVVAGGVLALLCAWGAAGTGSRVFAAVLGVAAIVMGVVLLRDELRPLRFGITPDGLQLREGPVPWSAVGHIVLEEPLPQPGSIVRTGPHLLLIPAGGTPADARAVLQLDDVRQSRAEVTEALARHAGDRFVDAPAERAAAVGRHDFGTVLRGYDPGAVDLLLRRAGDALRSGDPQLRQEVRADLAAGAVPVAARGYARDEVDRVLHGLAAKLSG